MRISRKILTLIFICCFMTTVQIGSADDNEFYYRLTITDANYADLDNDQSADDIYIDYYVKKYGEDDYFEDHYYKTHKYFLKVKLKLPSGNENTYWFLLDWNSQCSRYESRVNLYNNVTESGWYLAKLTLYYSYWKVASNDIFFDPPMNVGHE